MKKFLALLLLIFYLPAGFAKPDPSFTWTTLTSAHFQIHYHQGEEALAKRAVVIAEDVHARLVPRMKSRPHDRTHIVLIDALDDANGSATPLPYNLIKLYITQPYGDSIFGASNYDDWMRMLITHEYTHIVHLDMVNGLPQVLSNIFGNLYFPNLFQPVWMIEGLAVYEESELTGGGRNRSPASDMVLRMAVLEDNFPDISHAANYTEKWPDGEVPYLFGGSFTAFIANKFGREKLADLALDYSGRPLPYMVSSTVQRVLGRSYAGLWNEWKDELASRYRADKQKIMAQGLTPSRALTRRGYMNTAPAISPDGKQIAYFVQNADEHPAIHLMNIDGSDDRKLLDNMTTSAQSISWSPDGKGIYYTRIERVRNVNLYNDIYFYDLQRRREMRLTRNLRARDASPSPDGSRLVFVTNRLGKTRLATLSLPQQRTARAQEINWLTEESGTQYETPRFSPDGQKIAVGVRQADGYKDIWLLDSQGNKLDELMHDRAIDSGAVWSADGRSIYFSSDRSGVFNLYACDLASKKIARVSNVLGGAFMPSLTRDGNTIAFANYSSRGFDIHVLDNKPEEAASHAAWKTPSYIDPYPVMHYDEPEASAAKSPYNPLPTLAPHLWLPNFGSSSYSGRLGGFFTFGADAVERHSYMLSALYGPAKNRTWYDFIYTYDGMFPSLQLHAQDIDTAYAHLLSQQQGFAARSDYVERGRMLDAALTFPLQKIDRQQALTLGYRHKTVTGLSAVPPWGGYDGAIPAQGVLASGRLVYRFNNARTYGYSISPEGGRNIEIGYEKLDKQFGSDFKLEKYSADWHEYIDLPFQHHVLMLRGYAGKSSGDVIAQRAFQLGGVGPGDLAININDNNVYLRGYPINSYRGQNVGLATMEYRFPIHNLENGIGNLPFFFKRLHGAAFAEAGNAWDGAFLRSQLKRTVGAEASMDMTLSYFLPVTARLGLYKALDDQREKTMVLSLWVAL